MDSQKWASTIFFDENVNNKLNKVHCHIKTPQQFKKYLLVMSILLGNAPNINRQITNGKTEYIEKKKNIE